jgi:uncharacterized RDD family membrane protein YckC
MPICAKCAKNVTLGVNFCSFCGAPVSSDVPRTSVLPQGQVQVGVIVVMWLLTLGYFVFWTQKAMVLSSVCGFCSFVFGVALSFRRNQVDRTHGLFRVGIGVVMGLITFAAAMQHQ